MRFDVRFISKDASGARRIRFAGNPARRREAQPPQETQAPRKQTTNDRWQMAVSDEFLAYVMDQLSGLGEVSSRRMFGGAGLYCEGRIFAVVADDTAYLKVDDSNREDFVKAGSAPFNPYPEKAKGTSFYYYEIPPDVLEDPTVLAEWAKRSLDIARQGRQRKGGANRE